MFVWCNDIVTAIGECMISVYEKLDKAIKRISSLDGFAKVDFIIQYGTSKSNVADYFNESAILINHGNV